MKHRVVVLVSGNGTNLQAILDAVAAVPSPLPSVTVVRVVSNRRDAYALKRAEQAGIPTLYFPLKPFTSGGKSREEYDAQLAEILSEHEPDLIVLAGWMHVLSSAFLDRFPKKVINLHPALPHQFDGTHAIERAFEAFKAGKIDKTGIIVHYVIPEVDRGEVIVSKEVPITAEDTLEKLEERMHHVEHQLLVEAISRVLTPERFQQ